jgi:mRNA-degrading endonuclease RelE of RelBE toxin-antitoxin system
MQNLSEGPRDALMDAILALGTCPRPQSCIKIDPPVGVSSLLAHYRIREGEFRILYDIRDDLQKVYLLAIRRRNEKTYR